MSDDIFKDMREQMKPDLEVMTRLQTAIETDVAEGLPNGTDDLAARESQAQPDAFATGVGAKGEQGSLHLNTGSSIRGAQHKRAARSRRRAITYLSAAAAVLVVFIAVGVVISGIFPGRGMNGPTPPRPAVVGSSGSLAVGTGPVRAPADYQEIYQVLDEARTNYTYRFGGRGGADIKATSDNSNAVAPSVVYSAEAAQSSARDTSATGNYSETNVQVEGIDEGDIIKTDGRYIYVISGSQFLILEASGDETEELARVQVVFPNENGYTDEYVQELYLSGSKAIIVISRSNYFSLREGDNPRYDPGTSVLCVDTSNPSSPEYITEFYQSGYFNSSRLYNGVLYLLTNYALYDDIAEDAPGSYIPILAKGGVSELMRCDDIRIMPVVTYANYTVISSLDINTLERIDQKSILGSAETVYMSYDNLYIGSNLLVSEESEPYRESVYTIEEHFDRQSTQLIRIGLDRGSLDVAAQCTVDGVLLNQFSLDEYEGNLRLVTTIYSYSYRILRDKSHDIESIQYSDDSDQTNAVFVLDPSMNLIGSIEGLAKDERIYSARFSGPVGYMVTFRQVDPLFAIDLSDPTDPRITSELKIPGFSTYLHPFGEGRLLGIGYDVDSNRRGGMKMSMFDTADPFDVTELNMELVSISDSEALYNHKAVLVDVNRNIIGFGGNDWSSMNKSSIDKEYFVYAYVDYVGFVLKGRLDLTDSEKNNPYYYGGVIRGLYIDDYLYVYSGDYLDVFNLATLEKVQSLKISDDTEQGYRGAVPLAGIS